MKKIIVLSRLICLYGILCFTFISCAKDDSIQEGPSNSDIPQQKSKPSNCNVYLDEEVTIEWETDCSEATITVSLCCECVVGSRTGCTLEPGVLKIQVEEGPFEFYTYEKNIPYISIASGNCYNFEYVIQGNENDIIYLSQIWIDDVNQDFDWDYSYLQGPCPF